MMDYLEIIGTAIGIVYLYLEYKANVWVWVASIAMPAVYLSVYWNAGLYADFGISIYYLLASIYGLYCWLRGRNRQDGEDISPLRIQNFPKTLYPRVIIVFSLLFILIGYTLQNFTDSTVPWADAFTTALSIIAMWMLAKKYVEQWLVWIVADLACAVLYVYKDLWFTGALYLAYAVIAVFGYRKWKRIMAQESERPYNKTVAQKND